MLNKLRFQVHWYQRVFLPLKRSITWMRTKQNLLNTLRDSDMTSEEFINSLVGLQNAVMYSSEREPSTTDYDAVSDDGIFVKNPVILILKLLMKK
jgi:hypothetical protein